jgi:hypothetical protein
VAATRSVQTPTQAPQGYTGVLNCIWLLAHVLGSQTETKAVTCMHASTHAGRVAVTPCQPHLLPGVASVGGAFFADIMRGVPLDAGLGNSAAAGCWCCTAVGGVAALCTAAGLCTAGCCSSSCCCCLPERSLDTCLLWGRCSVAVSYCCSSCCLGTAGPCVGASPPPDVCLRAHGSSL